MKRTRSVLRDPAALIGGGIVLAICLAAVLAPVLAPYPQDLVAMHFGQRLRPPSALHLLGTDRVGADILTRLLFGARTTLTVAVIAVSAALAIGVPIGLVAGYWGRGLGEVLMRVSDVFLAIPQLILAIAIAETLGPALPNVILALSITYWPWFARLIYAQTLSALKEPYVDAALTIGAHPLRIMLRHVLPAVSSAIMVRTTVGLGFTILTAAALGFLGLGAPPDTPEWGRMVADSRDYLPDAWWYALAPGGAIFLLVMGFNLLGDGLRDLLDPRFAQAADTGRDA
ncbi:MAG TPA: ABC transporter permease [Acetobacteraceae bacterium]|jgi:peptide/nickel transport system permease protein|nr:ABC transporter permease [Acetobacteraceae bacterium]